MSVYLYKAKKGPNEIIGGQIEASTVQDALTKIDSLGLFPISLQEKGASFKKPTRVSLKDIVEFTHQLSTLINSGSTLLSSLNTLVSETEQVRLKPIILDITSQVKEGVDFSEALRKYPYIFSQLYISLVKIGETSGTLGENLKRIAEFLEEEMDFRTNIISILTYPFLIIGIGILTIFVLLKFVIPKLVDIFEEMGQVLPLPTQVLMYISNFFSKYWIIIMGATILLFFMIKRGLKAPHNRLKWDMFKLRLPMLGDLLKKIEAARLARTLSVLLKNGVPLDLSIRILTTTALNFYFQREMGKIAIKIKDGSSLSQSMRDTEMFGPAFVNVITVGENSGRLDDVLENLSNDYNKEISRKIKRLLNFLEPILIVGVGLMVGFVVLSMLLPIFQIDFNF